VLEYKINFRGIFKKKEDSRIEQKKLQEEINK